MHSLSEPRSKHTTMAQMGPLAVSCLAAWIVLPVLCRN